jgi:hypothetical protein
LGVIGRVIALPVGLQKSVIDVIAWAHDCSTCGFAKSVIGA